MKKHTVIVSGGSIQEEFVLAFLKEHAYNELIAVDNGLAFLYRHQILPTRIVGDFDTIDVSIIDWYRANTKIEILKFDPVKDATDTQIAVELALRLGSNKISILGGMGNRMDHTIGNIQTMMLALKAGVSCQLLDWNNRIRLVDAPIKIRKEAQYGDYVSLLPLTSAVTGITLRGFKYPLQDYVLTSTESAGLGVSNEIVEEEGEISFSKGVLMLMETRD